MNERELDTLLYGKTSNVVETLYVSPEQQWLCSPKHGGFGLEKGIFLSYLILVWGRRRFKRSNEMYLRIGDTADMLGMTKINTRRHLYYFRDLGYYTTEVRQSLIDKNGLLYIKPTETFPSPERQSFYRIPIKLLASDTLGGLGARDGSTLFLILNRNRESLWGPMNLDTRFLSSALSADRKTVIESVNRFDRLGLMVKMGKRFLLNTELFRIYVKALDSFWKSQGQRGQRERKRPKILGVDITEWLRT